MKSWRRLIANGAVWTLVYNLIWGVAWFAFMRGEWERGTAAIHHEMPFTAEVWFLMVVLSVPMGIAIMAYTRDRPEAARRAAVSAALVLWLVFTVPMFIHAMQQSLPMRVIVLDSGVNLIAVIAASLAAAWSQMG